MSQPGRSPSPDHAGPKPGPQGAGSAELSFILSRSGAFSGGRRLPDRGPDRFVHRRPFDSRSHSWGALLPGKTRTLSVPFHSPDLPHATLMSLTVAFTGIVFDDETTAGNSSGLQRIFQKRDMQSAALLRWCADLSQVSHGSVSKKTLKDFVESHSNSNPIPHRAWARGRSTIRTQSRRRGPRSALRGVAGVRWVNTRGLQFEPNCPHEASAAGRAVTIRSQSDGGPRSARVHSLSIQLSRNMLRRRFAAATGTLSSPAYEYHAEVRFRVRDGRRLLTGLGKL